MFGEFTSNTSVTQGMQAVVYSLIATVLYDLLKLGWLKWRWVLPIVLAGACLFASLAWLTLPLVLDGTLSKTLGAAAGGGALIGMVGSVQRADDKKKRREIITKSDPGLHVFLSWVAVMVLALVALSTAAWVYWNRPDLLVDRSFPIGFAVNLGAIAVLTSIFVYLHQRFLR